MSKQSDAVSALTVIDADVAAHLVSRRHAITKGVTTSGLVMAGLRIGTVPAALAALATDAYGQGRLPTVVSGVLNFALRLEYLEAEFYNLGVAAPNLIPQADRQIFTTIQAHENAHVQYLRDTLGTAARPKPVFDFTAGNGAGNGPFADVFTNYNTFKAVAQAFEDTGVRAYKGQAPALQPYKDVLQAALTIHSVEARHAAEIRRLRGNFADNEPNEGWITNADTDITGTAAVYAGEANTTQLGLNVTTVTSVSAKEVTEAFDEPLTMAAVLAIIDPFIV
ncbi:ferritin-like domain-containing protein [Gemmatimonas groenlandica]|uniref:Ferritin-like domain-containing protein n=1 Tax=Gemmatimonas groenlandica TaxID=2732249 RepID=A0A6M4IUJ8_9BACT|nr:ferritin-like domain-containing protein [Gemmatimonas groenlandica]QJR36502.1 ferritin-like domain-containing protein [Gemmatimonas groenlandica]